MVTLITFSLIYTTYFYDGSNLVGNYITVNPDGSTNHYAKDQLPRNYDVDNSPGRKQDSEHVTGISGMDPEGGDGDYVRDPDAYGLVYGRPTSWAPVNFVLSKEVYEQFAKMYPQTYKYDDSAYPGYICGKGFNADDGMARSVFKGTRGINGELICIQTALV